jgi:hypothetical protein
LRDGWRREGEFGGVGDVRDVRYVGRSTRIGRIIVGKIGKVERDWRDRRWRERLTLVCNGVHPRRRRWLRRSILISLILWVCLARTGRSKGVHESGKTADFRSRD